MLTQLQERLEQSKCREEEKDTAMKKLRKMDADQIEKRFVGQQYFSVEQRRGMVEKIKSEFGEVAPALVGQCWLTLGPKGVLVFAYNSCS